MAGNIQPDLQKLRAWRQEQEAQVLQEYGRALKAQDQAVSRLESLRQEFQEAQARLETRIRRGAGPSQLSQLQAQCNALEQSRLVSEHLAKAARNHTRLTFTKLMAARYTSALIKNWQNQILPEKAVTPPAPNPGQAHLAPLKLSLFALLTQTTRQALWN